jgi:hypothetical protein
MGITAPPMAPPGDSGRVLTLRRLDGATPVANEMSEVDRLYQLWSTYQAQVAWRDAVAHGADVAVAAQALIGLPEVSVLEALDANRRLVDMLLQRRRDAVSAARKDGSSWAAIGAALGTSKQRAYAWYHHRISH